MGTQDTDLRDCITTGVLYKAQHRKSLASEHCWNKKQTWHLPQIVLEVTWENQIKLDKSMQHGVSLKSKNHGWETGNNTQVTLCPSSIKLDAVRPATCLAFSCCVRLEQRCPGWQPLQSRQSQGCLAVTVSPQTATEREQRMYPAVYRTNRLCLPHSDTAEAEMHHCKCEPPVHWICFREIDSAHFRQSVNKPKLVPLRRVRLY